MRGLGHLPQPLLGRVCLLLTHTFPSPARCFYLTVHTSASCAPAARQLVCLTRGRLPPSPPTLPTPTSAPTGARERLWDVLCLQMCSFCSREADACSFVAFLNCQCSSFFIQQLTQSLNLVSSRTFLDVFFSYAVLLELVNASWTLTLPCLGLFHHRLMYVAQLFSHPLLFCASIGGVLWDRVPLGSNEELGRVLENCPQAVRDVHEKQFLLFWTLNESM